MFATVCVCLCVCVRGERVYCSATMGGSISGMTASKYYVRRGAAVYIVVVGTCWIEWKCHARVRQTVDC